MSLSPRSHLYRLALLLVIAIAGFVHVKDWFVPEGWDDKRWFRTAALEELKLQPVRFGGNATCAGQCHGKTRKNHMAVGSMLESGVHASLGCESCHGPLHDGEHQKVAKAQVPRDSTVCLRCHDNVAGRPITVGLFSESQMAHKALGVKKDTNCVVCHDPHLPRKKTVAEQRGQGEGSWLPGIMALAEGGCNSCHKPGVPFMPLIAGQPLQYLTAVMQQQRDGIRHSFVMGDLLKDYTDEKIEMLAEYYANSVWTSAGEATSARLVREGAAVHRRSCAGCHGEGGRHAAGMIPRLAGQNMSYFKSQMSAYLDPQGSMPSEVMKTIARDVSPAEIEALAHYYAAEPTGAGEGDDVQALIAGCNTCHRAGFRDMPLISGQPEEYLRTVLKQLRDGTRDSRVMNDLLRGYSDETVGALAEHYARSGWLPAREKTSARLVRAGAALHEAGCAGCHGVAGEKSGGMTPRLSGQPAGYIEAMLLKFKDPRSKQPSRLMRAAATTLTTNDIKALAQYYASSPAGKQAAAAEAAAPAGMADVSGIVGSCDNCHAIENEPTDAPLIDGQPEAFLKTVLLQYRDGSRSGEAMVRIMKKYDADQSAALANHYAGRKWVSVASQTKPELIKQGKALHDAGCGSCHGDDGRAADGKTPRLAGQPVQFLENAIRLYQDPASRLPNKFMRSAVKSLSANDVSALAHFYASQIK